MGRFSKLHTETSLNTFINECLIPISTSPNFLAGNMLYTQTKPGVLKCLNDKIYNSAIVSEDMIILLKY